MLCFLHNVYHFKINHKIICLYITQQKEVYRSIYKDCKANLLGAAMLGISITPMDTETEVSHTRCCNTTPLAQLKYISSYTKYLVFKFIIETIRIVSTETWQNISKSTLHQNSIRHLMIFCQPIQTSNKISKKPLKVLSESLQQHLHSMPFNTVITHKRINYTRHTIMLINWCFTALNLINFAWKLRYWHAFWDVNSVIKNCAHHALIQ